MQIKIKKIKKKKLQRFDCPASLEARSSLQSFTIVCKAAG